MSKRTKRKEGLKDLADSVKGGISAGKDLVHGTINLADAARQAVTGKPISAVKSTIQGVGNVIKGGVQHVKNIVKGVRGVFKTLFNHPEWYLNYDSGNMINANYGINKGVREVILNDGKTTIVNAVGLDTILCIPQTKANEWHQGIHILYNTLRSANAGAINYSLYDLEKYVHNVRNLHALYCIMRRAFATLRNIDKYDSTTPASLFAAQGLDYVTFSENAANLKMFGNRFSVAISNLFPIRMNLIDRTDWMFSNFFMDSNDAKATPYCFRIQHRVEIDAGGQSRTIEGIYKFLPGASSATQLKFSDEISSTATGIDYNTFVSNVNAYLEDMMSNQVLSVIAGDMLKAFGQSAVYPVEIWPDDMTVPCVYDEAALTQIQNATITPALTNTVSGGVNAWISNIYGGVRSDNTYQGRTGNWGATRSVMAPINMYKDNITPGDTLSASRLMTVFAGVTSGATPLTTFATVEIATEFICEIRYYYRSQSSNLYDLEYTYYDGTVFTTAAFFANIAEKWSSVDYGPCIIFGSSTSTDVHTMFDYNNYAIVSATNLSSYHGYAILSLLAVPRLAKLSNTQLIQD